MYFDILRRLTDGVRRKRPENWTTNSWFPLHDNAPAHRSVLLKDFLAKNNLATLENPPYSPYLPAADFYLFPQLKPALKGRCFCDTNDIFKNANERVKRLSQNGFQECFQHLCSRWQKFTAAQVDFFEENVASMIVQFCISQKQSDSGNILKLPPIKWCSNVK